MTRVKGTYKDRGHYTRKAVAYTVVTLMFPVYALCTVGEKLGEVIGNASSRLHRWSHPCLYAKRPPIGVKRIPSGRVGVDW